MPRKQVPAASKRTPFPRPEASNFRGLGLDPDLKVSDGLHLTEDLQRTVKAGALP